jgi:hypothetical protein
MTSEDTVRLLQQQSRKAIQSNRASRRKHKRLGTFDGRTASGIVVPDPEPSPEHFHAIYNIPAEGLSLPHWRQVYLNRHEAREAIAEIARQGEPNVEWYEDGQVGVEMRMPDRTGLFWIILEIAACIRSQCVASLRRENVKRALVVLPGKK